MIPKLRSRAEAVRPASHGARRSAQSFSHEARPTYSVRARATAMSVLRPSSWAGQERTQTRAITAGPASQTKTGAKRLASQSITRGRADPSRRRRRTMPVSSHVDSRSCSGRPFTLAGAAVTASVYFRMVRCRLM